MSSTSQSTVTCFRFRTYSGHQKGEKSQVLGVGDGKEIRKRAIPACLCCCKHQKVLRDSGMIPMLT